MAWWLILFGIFVHLVFFYSIFDIYFTSPLVHGMTPQSTPVAAPARRLVLFVADGLRADKLFELDEHNQSRAPYIRSVTQNFGAWGVSHTRVPTESRPGHVALIAGFYEDVSAITKGWKENPVEFDSVFNESQFTWSWGSPDILPMFSKGASGSHVYTEMYPGESEDFAGADLGKLDTWVFDKVKEFLKQADHDVLLAEKLNKEKVVLFMHLLGLDTNGHAHKPYSKEYLNNIKLVDKGVEEMVASLEEYFEHDGGTAYVFTADHGMTNWGSHGAGHPSETLTPLVVWGAGVRKPLPATLQYVHDGFEKEWKINTKRSDVSQADIAALMASLIGIAFPLNSVGVLPLDYLDGSTEFKAECLFTNARQIVAQFEVKMMQKQKTTLTILFSPFKKLTPSMQADKLRHIRKLIHEGNFHDSISESQELIDLALEGLKYYHNYDKLFLGFSICMGFIAWIIYVFTMLVQKHTNIIQRHSQLDRLQESFWSSEKGLRILFTIFGIVLIVFLYIQSLPLNYYLYCVIPVILWHKVAQRHKILKDVYYYVVDCGYIINTLILGLTGLGGLELIVWSFSYRELLSVGLVAMAAWSLTLSTDHVEKHLQRGWIISLIGLAVFPMLPVVGREPNYYLVYLAGVLAFCCGIYICFREEMAVSSISDHRKWKTRTLASFQLLLILLSLLILYNTQSNISEKHGLPLLNQILSWFILFLSFLLPLLSPTMLYQRLMSIALSFAPLYILLSTAHEALFFLNLCCVMYFWLRIENNVRERKIARVEYLDFRISQRLGEVHRKLLLSDLRCAYFFIFFLFTAFFGTGNIASINSFDPSSVLCFLTVFNPFVMGALMMWKILVPFMLVTCTFNAVHLCVNVPTQSLFLLVLLMSDIMALNFFFLVRDYGSWLEIGTSISHYVIVMGTIIFLNVLLAVSRVFTNFQIEWKRSREGGKEI